MIGLVSTTTSLATLLAAPAALAQADQAFVRLGNQFFREQGLVPQCMDNFLCVNIPLRANDDPHGFLRTLGNMQNVLQDRVRLVSVQNRGDDLTAHLGFPYPSLLCGLLTSLFGAQAMNPIFLSRDVPRDEINRMYTRNEQPIGVFDHPVFLADVNALVHGFIFMYHDLYHLVFGSALPQSFRKMWATVFNRIETLPPNVLVTPVAQNLLNCLVDNDVDLRFAESEAMLAFVPFRAVMDRIQEAVAIEDAEGALLVFNECRLLLCSLIETLDEKDPSFVHADFMMRNLREMRRIVETQMSLRDHLEGFF